MAAATDHDQSIPAPPRRDRRDLVVFAALTAVIWGTLLGPQVAALYPFVYDEQPYLVKVRAYDEWLSEGIVRAAQGNPGWLFSREVVADAEAVRDMHPGFAKFAALLPHWLVKAAIGREGGARLAPALFLALACGALYWFLAPRVGRGWAVVGALGLASLPRVFGHGHLLTMDVPIMAMYLVAALALRRAAMLDRTWPAVGAGVLAGCALATKLNALALAPHVVVWAVIARPKGWKRTLAGSAVALPVFFALWPWLWHDPAAKLAEYVSFHAGHFHVGVSYLGTVYGGSTTAPASYVPVMLALTTPVPWLVLALSGIVWAVRGKLGDAGIFLALGLLANAGLLMVPGAARYGGVRLMLPALPFLVGLGTLMAARVSEVLRERGPGRRLAAAVVGTVLLAPGIIGCARYYPYCLSYYAEPLGLRGAARLGMDATYYGDAFGGAREFMAAPEHRRERFYTSNEWATACIDALIVAGEIPREERLVGQFITDGIPRDADWIIADNHPPGWPEPVEELTESAGAEFSVERDGVWLLRIYRGPRQVRPSRAGEEETGARAG